MVRLDQPETEHEEHVHAGDVDVSIDEGSPNQKMDDKGKILEIEHPDGSITISLDGKGISEDGPSEAEHAKKWFRNLAVSEIVRAKLEELHPQFPKPLFDLTKIRIV